MRSTPSRLQDPSRVLGVAVPRGEAWYRLAGQRFVAEWRLKFWASVAFVISFFTGYFLLLKFPVFPATIMPALALDRFVPFTAGALGLYVSLWLYVQIPAALLPTRQDVIAYGISITELALAGFAVFFFWPTKLAAAPIDAFEHPAFHFLQGVDASGNACPSLHVAFAVFSALSIERSLRAIGAPIVIHVLNTAWCLGIAYSTLATRQHVSLDVLAGALLALLIDALRRPKRTGSLVCGDQVRHP